MFKRLVDYQEELRRKPPQEPEYEYKMIDGNWTIKPIGYCHRYRGYLTYNMAQTHHCVERNCAMFKTLEQYQEYLSKKANKNH